MKSVIFINRLTKWDTTKLKNIFLNIAMHIGHYNAFVTKLLIQKVQEKNRLYFINVTNMINTFRDTKNIVGIEKTKVNKLR